MAMPHSFSPITFATLSPLRGPSASSASRLSPASSPRQSFEMSGVLIRSPFVLNTYKKRAYKNRGRIGRGALPVFVSLFFDDTIIALKKVQKGK
jgi:hypothetical protein